jgi:hypothetical protein
MENYKPAEPQYEAYTDKEGKEKHHSVSRQAALNDTYYSRISDISYTDYLFQLSPCGSSLPTSPSAIHPRLAIIFLWSFGNNAQRLPALRYMQYRVKSPPGYRSEMRRSSGRSSTTPIISTPPSTYAVSALDGPSYAVRCLCVQPPPPLPAPKADYL